MLSKIKEKHGDKTLALICEDYFTCDLGNLKFDTVISFETLHHFKPEKKKQLFQKIYASLKDGCHYIECDYIACCEEEEQVLAAECERKRKLSGIPDDVFVHFDTPLTLQHEILLMKESGFSEVSAVDSINGATFIIARK